MNVPTNKDAITGTITTFFFNDTATTEIYTLSLHDALPIFKDNIPDWKVQTNEWNVEDTGAWKTEDTDNFFYEIEEKK